MMNRTLQYLKNIKYNPKVNSKIANQSKRKNTFIYFNSRQKNLNKRNYSTTSFGPKDQPPKDTFWIIVASIICGGGFKIQENSKD
jgi:hypothetical protein